MLLSALQTGSDKRTMFGCRRIDHNGVRCH